MWHESSKQIGPFFLVQEKSQQHLPTSLLLQRWLLFCIPPHPSKQTRHIFRSNQTNISHSSAWRLVGFPTGLGAEVAESEQMLEDVRRTHDVSWLVGDPPPRAPKKTYGKFKFGRICLKTCGKFLGVEIGWRQLIKNSSLLNTCSE